MATLSGQTEGLKGEVRSFWDARACGEVYARGEELRDALAAQAAERYRLEPYLKPFARFADGAGRDVLEVGVGMGADHLQWARAGARPVGVDLTRRAVDFTRARLALEGFSPRVVLGDAERLPFPDAAFDLVYSWGVLHHSPDTPRAIAEARRVLRPGGEARVMIYHRRALVGYMLWVRYALLRTRPFRGLDEIYARHLESPGTKAYSLRQAREMFADFGSVVVRVQLSFGDLLQGGVGQRHRGPLLRIASAVWPRWLLRRTMSGHGLYLLVEATK